MKSGCVSISDFFEKLSNQLEEILQLIKTIEVTEILLLYANDTNFSSTRNFYANAHDINIFKKVQIL